MTKARDAFRTISEVSEWLDTPTYVLRFWESRFAQIKPVKRAGGRRYYRPEDMLLLGGIKKLLHFDGHTIKGVQNMIKEHSAKYVSEFSPGLDEQVVSPKPKDESVKVDIDSLIKGSRAKERNKARSKPMQLNKGNKDTAKQGNRASAAKGKPTAETTTPNVDLKKQRASAVNITVPKKSKAKTPRPVQKATPAPNKPIEIPKDKLVPGPFKVGPARSYSDNRFQEIETLYYSLKMVRNNMKRAHAAR